MPPLTSLINAGPLAQSHSEGNGIGVSNFENITNRKLCSRIGVSKPRIVKGFPEIFSREGAAIGIRETGFRNINQADGDGRGIFQIDIGKNPSVTEAQARNVGFAAGWALTTLAFNAASLAKVLDSADPKFMQALAASWNHGLGGVTGDLRNGLSPDVHTTHHNYGSNVVD